MALFDFFRKRDPNELLKMATKQKKEDIDLAINTLREAYQAISKTRTTYSVETFLRLPMYLQEAGRGSEAWEEFSALLRRGFPNEIRNKEIAPMNRSLIYGKIRLFLQREGQSEYAIKYGILSHVNWCLGLHYQSRKKELRSFLTKNALTEMVKPLLKKAKISDQEGEIVDVVREHLTAFPDVDQVRLAEDVDRIAGVNINS